MLALLFTPSCYVVQAPGRVSGNRSPVPTMLWDPNEDSPSPFAAPPEALPPDPDATRDSADAANAKPWQLDAGGKEKVEKMLTDEQKAYFVLPEESFKVEKLDMSQTDEDFEMEVSYPFETADVFIDIYPMFATQKPAYFYGFTADSADIIKVDTMGSSEIEGEMNSKGGRESSGSERIPCSLLIITRGLDADERVFESLIWQPVSIKVTFDPKGATGDFEAYLCFILPEEQNFSRFYKITAKSPEV